MGSFFALVGIVLGLIVGYEATTKKNNTWKAVGIGGGIVGGAVVGQVVDNATGV